MKILFPVSYRSHLARQRYLVKELERDFDLIIPNLELLPYGPMNERSLDAAKRFKNIARLNRFSGRHIFCRGD